MKKYSIKLMILLLVSFVVYPATSGAVMTDQSGSVGVRVLVSKDGTNWLNYSNTNDESPTSQVLKVSAGDTIYFKGEVWNAGETDVFPGLYAIIKNSKYLENIGAFESSEGNDDLDNDGIFYQVLNVDTTDEYSAMALEFSAPLTIDPLVGIQSGMIQATVKSDVPENTVIEGVFALVFTDIGPTSIDSQDAFTDAIDQLPEQATVRILANEVESAQVATLPETGGTSKTGLINLYATVGGLLMLAGLGVIQIVKKRN